MASQLIIAGKKVKSATITNEELNIINKPLKKFVIGSKTYIFGGGSTASIPTYNIMLRDFGSGNKTGYVDTPNKRENVEFILGMVHADAYNYGVVFGRNVFDNRLTGAFIYSTSLNTLKGRDFANHVGQKVILTYHAAGSGYFTATFTNP